MSLIKITSRHKGIPEEAKDYAYLKSEKLKHYLDRITKIEFVLEQDKNISIVELIVAANRGTLLVSREANKDIFRSIELVSDKMEKQLVKLKEKLRGRRAKDFQNKIKKQHPQKPDSDATSYSGLNQDDWY
jgi:putative sigma-54 modulation protein